MGHSVGDAAKRSTAKGDAVKKSERTSEQIMKDLRHNLASNLAVTPDDQRFLLAQYDVLLKNFIEQQTVAFQQGVENAKKIAELQAKNEEFRSVYEAENSSQTLKVETLASGEAGTAGAKGTTGASGMAGAVPTE